MVFKMDTTRKKAKEDIYNIRKYFPNNVLTILIRILICFRNNIGGICYMIECTIVIRSLYTSTITMTVTIVRQICYCRQLSFRHF